MAEEAASEPSLQPQIVESIPEVFKHTVEYCKAANKLPRTGANYELYSTYSTFVQLMDLEAERIQSLINRIYSKAGLKHRLTGSLLEQQERLVDCNDVIVERIGNALDEATGVRKPFSETPLLIAPHTPMSISTTWNREQYSTSTQADQPSTSSSQSQSSVSDTGDLSTPDTNKSQNSSASSQFATPSAPTAARKVTLLANKVVAKPQALFNDLIDNTMRPFVHRVRVKHHAKNKPKGSIAMTVDGESVQEISEDQDETNHPYGFELNSYVPLDSQLEKIPEPEVPKPLSDTPLTLVETVQALESLVNELSSESLIAVDLEHHSYRTFLGLTCLMQISTKDRDYIVDTLALWRDMWKINEVFAKPQIVKVFHGADQDVEWIQRDFGVYVVNMFDTGIAMRLLNYPKFSLAYLVKSKLDIDLRKSFQLADWRIRPLVGEMIEYARSDTHYLLYCYECLNNELIDKSNEQKNLLQAVLFRSRDLCLKEYQKPDFDENCYEQLIQKTKKNLNKRQKQCLKELYRWRDARARIEDESVHFILPSHMLMHIAEVLPREAQGVLACCNPIPPAVKQELQELHRIVYRAREMALDQVCMVFL